MLSQFDDDETATYFERLNSELRRMPREARAELHVELRQHLDALAAAHEELGATPEEAARGALKQFGDPTQIGRKLFSEWRRSLLGSHPLWLAVGHMTLWKLVMLAVPLASNFPLNPNDYNSVGNALFSVHTFYLIYFLVPLLAGMVTGWKIPDKAASGALYSGALFVLPFALLMRGCGVFGLTIALVWLAVSFVGAYAASAYQYGGFYCLSWTDFKLDFSRKENSHATRV